MSWQKYKNFRSKFSINSNSILIKKIEFYKWENKIGKIKKKR